MSATRDIYINLIVFDGDDTLWFGLDGGYISGINYSDYGSDTYTFRRIEEDLIERNDGQRFRLYPEVRSLLAKLTSMKLLISLASYNHPTPVEKALYAFEINQFFFHPVVEYSSQKDKMLKTILRKLTQSGWLVNPSTTLFIDDDHQNRYLQQMESIGVHFLKKSSDITSLNELINNPKFQLVPAQKSLI